jgi:hypothetical protein
MSSQTVLCVVNQNRGLTCEYIVGVDVFDGEVVDCLVPTVGVGSLDRDLCVVPRAVPQVMARLQFGRSAVYDLLRTGQLASITLGRVRRIPTHALTDFIRTRLEQDSA